MSRIPAPHFKRLGAAPSAGDLKGFLDYLRESVPSAITTIASHTASLLLKADKKLRVAVPVIANTHTLISSAAGSITEFTHASGCTVTVNAGVFEEGEVINLVSTQAQITLVEGTGVTIHTPGTLLNRAAYSPIALICMNDDGDEFYLTGDLEV